MFRNKETFKREFREKLESVYGISIEESGTLEKYQTLGNMVREYISKNWIATKNKYKKTGTRQAYYFSMEFLMGQLMQVNLTNLSLFKLCEVGLAELGIDIKELIAEEPDAGLGNGGLGRLAACFLDSLASLGLPGHGCGIRYKYGLFEQKIVNGYQVELPDNWLKESNIWEVRRPERSFEVKFGGEVHVRETDGRLTFEHVNYETVLAVAYDMPVVGYNNNTVNTLRLWSAESTREETETVSIEGGTRKFIDYRNSTESISEFLYPDDSYREGQILRLKQEYFLVSAGIQSIINNYKRNYKHLTGLPDKVAIHINDAHPVLAIPEMMRILLDEEGMDWDTAWAITTGVMSYTNHTILPEALEKWPMELVKNLLPRINMIIEEINERFCREIWNRYPGDWGRVSNTAIVSQQQINMVSLALVGSYSVNGVSKIHTEILKNKELKNYYELFPEKFSNKTNGITHRRWLLKANPSLTNVISKAIGQNWIANPMELSKLLDYTQDPAFQEEVKKAKNINKIKLANYIKENCGVSVDPASVFDVQVKRLHLYKRQLLNVFNIMDLYNKLKENPDINIQPITFIFGAKSAPNYHLSKKVIKLINTLADMVNKDKSIGGKLKVVFLENYRVAMAEKVIPAADISEQISVATKEASGTGNMKFMMNGAITLGTLDGANIEIMEAVGNDNIFIFGLTPSEVIHYREAGGYNAWDIYNSNPRIKNILDQLNQGFLPAARNEFEMIYHFLLYNNDEFFVLKDFAPYIEVRSRILQLYGNSNKWTEMCINNIAHSGRFSSDRTIMEYARDIWRIEPVTI